MFFFLTTLTADISPLSVYSIALPIRLSVFLYLPFDCITFVPIFVLQLSQFHVTRSHRFLINRPLKISQLSAISDNAKESKIGRTALK